MGDFTAFATQVSAAAFRLGVQLSAPFIVFAMVINVGLGVLARIMPALPIFFVIVPLQIWVAFLLLGLTMAGIVEFHTSFFEESMTQLLGGI
jgi:flagellar biosynthetic protein FliR